MRRLPLNGGKPSALGIPRPLLAPPQSGRTAKPPGEPRLWLNDPAFPPPLPLVMRLSAQCPPSNPTGHHQSHYRTRSSPGGGKIKKTDMAKP